MRADEGTSLVLVTHDATLAKRAARRVHMAAGEIVRIESDDASVIDDASATSEDR
jgi:ABC-type lipoprotein export system ATPase subunit